MAWYRAGTVAVTNGSAILTGTGTAFIANVQPGHAINLPDGKTYEVLSVDSNTQITLGSNYLGSTASGQAYSVQANQGFAQYAYQQLASFLSTFGVYVTTILAGKMPSGSAGNPGICFSADQDTGLLLAGANTIDIVTGGTARARVSANGDLGIGATPEARLHAVSVGGTASPFGLVTTMLLTGDYTRSDNSDYVQRKLYAGLINYAFGLQASDGSAVMPLVLNGQGGNVGVGTTAPTFTLEANGVIGHSIDNSYAFASSGKRGSTIYLASSPIVTSDAQAKTVRGPLTEAELAAAKDIADSIVIYQLNDAIEKKGAENARWHVGTIAQTVITILSSHGLAPLKYGFVCYDEWGSTPEVPAQPARPEIRDGEGNMIMFAQPATDAIPAIEAGSRYSIRYDELSMFVAAAQEQRLLAIEAYIASHA